ncbi:hypothetical protein BDD12DRAFT_897564 [Trichophaea hybrida]|nr:hypothetical protein BDD12DRAFT_897564 [Trichophaea hybrida]
MSSAASGAFYSAMEELRTIIIDLQNQLTVKDQQIQKSIKELEKERNERALDKESIKALKGELIKALKGEVTEDPEETSKGLEEARNRAMERMIETHNRMQLWSGEPAAETMEERVANDTGEGLDLEEARNKAIKRVIEAHNRMKLWSGGPPLGEAITKALVLFLTFGFVSGVVFLGVTIPRDRQTPIT